MLDTADEDRRKMCTERPNLSESPADVDRFSLKAIDWYNDHTENARPTMLRPAPQGYTSSAVVLPVDPSKGYYTYPNEYHVRNPEDPYGGVDTYDHGNEKTLTGLECELDIISDG